MVTIGTGYSRNLFFALYITGLAFYVLAAILTFSLSNPKESKSSFIRTERSRFKNDLKYILVWTTEKYNRMGMKEGQQDFLKRNCSVFNCFLTSNKSLLNGDYTNFDAIVFNSHLLEEWNRENLPKQRLAHQLYVFHSKTPPDMEQKSYLEGYIDGYFNLTWTYKLSSDIVSPFIEVRDMQGNPKAPNTSITWDMKEDFTDVEDIYDIKKKAAATVLENCGTNNNISYLKALQTIMKRRFSVYDIFGCNMEKCRTPFCRDKVTEEYYFYIVHEYESSEDYLTKNVLHAYMNKAIPVVLGTQNYQYFLPYHSYIPIGSLSPFKTALLFRDVINDKSMYLSFFHWKLLYTIHGVDDLRGICELCSILDRNEKRKSESSKNFRQWWFK